MTPFVEKILGIITASAVFILVFCRGISTPADPDLWGNVRYGQDILSLGKLPFADPYSYLTENVRWINHEWLWETLVGFVYNSAAAPGLVALKCFCVLSFSIMLWRFLVRNGFSVMRASELLLLCEVMLLPSTTTLRANVITCLFFTMELLILNKCSKDVAAGRKALWLLAAPLLFALWANTHGAFIFGLGIMSAWWLSSVIEARIAGKLPWRDSATWLLLAILPISFLATTLNPYGLELWQVLLKTATIPRPDITEFQPLGITANGIFGWFYLAAVVIGTLSLVFSRRTKRLSDCTLFIALACAPELAYRLLPLFVIGWVFLVSPYVADAGSALYQKLKAKPLLLFPLQAFWISVLLFSAAGFLSQLSGSRPGQMEVSSYMPVQAVSILKKNNVSGKALVQFNWGHYFIWHLGPKLKVAVDGRRETVYSADVRAMYANFSTASGDWDALLEKYPPDLVVMEPKVAASNVMALKPGWVRAYSDRACSIFVRKDSELQTILGNLKTTKEPESGPVTYFP